MSSSNNKCPTIPFIIYLIVLIGLIYAFHIELFVTGVRIYVTAVNDPRAERLLGDYYRNSAHLSADLANTFYMNAMKKYRADLPSANPIEQANIKFQIGRFYLCAKGVPQNQAEAKRWFDDALQTITAASNASEPEHNALIANIKVSAATIGQSVDSILACQPQTEAEFISKTFNSD